MEITRWRRTSWFVATTLLLAVWMGILGSLPHDALGGVIPSHGKESVGGRDTDLRQLERFLETKIARQKLEDFGVPPDVAMAKLREMSDQDLHVLASMADRFPEGGAEGVTILEIVQVLAVVGLVAAVILIILGAIGIGILAKYLKKKSETRQTPPLPEPAAEPAKQ
ncbi:MAG: PA2779 family protein [Methanothrix sp.]|nr:PA2779 family protein [Methanothrix sp.]